MHARAAYSFALHAVFFISIVDLSKQREREKERERERETVLHY